MTVHPIYGKDRFSQLVELEPMLGHLEQLVRNCGQQPCREKFYRLHVRPMVRMLLGPTRTRPDRLVASAAGLYSVGAQRMAELRLRHLLPDCDGHRHVPIADAAGHDVQPGLRATSTSGRTLGKVVAALEAPPGRPMVIYED